MRPFLAIVVLFAVAIAAGLLLGEDPPVQKPEICILPDAPVSTGHFGQQPVSTQTYFGPGPENNEQR